MSQCFQMQCLINILTYWSSMEHTLGNMICNHWRDKKNKRVQWWLNSDHKVQVVSIWNLDWVEWSYYHLNGDYHHRLTAGTSPTIWMDLHKESWFITHVTILCGNLKIQDSSILCLKHPLSASKSSSIFSASEKDKEWRLS